MRSKFAVILALASTNIFAQDLILGDLNFIQKAQTVRWDTQLNFTKHEFRDILDNTDKSNFSDYENKINDWSNKVTYGISDKLDLGLSFDYAYKDEMTNTNRVPSHIYSKSKSFDSEGLSDITINSVYRLMSDKVYVDLTSDFTLALEDQKVGTSDGTESKNGNNKQGHYSFDLGASLGQKIDAFEWRAGLGLDYHFSGDYDQKVIGMDDVKVNTDSRLDLSLKGQVQYRPISKLALGLGFEWGKIGEQTSDTIISEQLADSSIIWKKLKTTRAPYFTEGIDLSAKYNLSDSILVYTGYIFSSNFDVDTKNEIEGQTIYGVEEDNKVSSYYLGGSFLF